VDQIWCPDEGTSLGDTEQLPFKTLSLHQLHEKVLIGPVIRLAHSHPQVVIVVLMQPMAAWIIKERPPFPVPRSPRKVKCLEREGWPAGEHYRCGG